MEAWTLLVGLLSGSLDSAERHQGLPPGLGRGHSGGDVCLDLLFEVELQLVVYFTRGPGSQQKAEARSPFLKHRHSSLSGRLPSFPSALNKRMRLSFVECQGERLRLTWTWLADTHSSQNKA
jgi:hypothetical protein